MNKKNARMWIFAVMLLLVFGAVTAGCTGQTDGKPHASLSATGGEPAEQPAGEAAGKDETQAAETDDAKKELSISSRDDQADGNDNRKDTPAEPPVYNVAEPFDKARPTLMGFSIGDSAEAVVTRFGKPLAETSMNDGQYLHVLEYPGFRFGADEDNKIVFIEVLTDQVAPGLNQFRIGQTVEEAQRALGPADSLNEYVMIYNFDGVVLKCDLNPNNNTVIAIRLFEA